MTLAEARDFLENKVVIDVGVLSAEGVVKTTEAIDIALDAMEAVEKLEAENKNLENLVAINKGAMRAYREACENAHDEAVADFSHFLIDKAKDGSIDICDLPDLVAEWKDKLPQSAELTAPSRKEPDEVWLMERFMKVE